MYAVVVNLTFTTCIDIFVAVCLIDDINYNHILGAFCIFLSSDGYRLLYSIHHSLL